MANALGKKLGVTPAQIKKVRAEEMKLTNQAMMAMQKGFIAEFRRLIEERDAQTDWLRTYAY